jgi:hypothetical protein
MCFFVGAGVCLGQSAPGNLPFPPNGPPPAQTTPPAHAPDQAAPAQDGHEPSFFDGWHWTGNGHEPPEHPSDRCGFRVEYLLWWERNASVPVSLLTTGPANAPIIGGLTQRGTRSLFGPTDIDYSAFNGVRLTGDVWLDHDRCLGLEASYFLLEQRSSGIAFSSDANGNPVLAQPLIDPKTGQEFTEVLALPGLIAGNTVITSNTRLQGGDFNLISNLCSGEIVSFYVLAGFRTLFLEDELQMLSGLTPLVDQFLTFEGAPIAQTSTLSTLDRFRAQNRFYGGQVGARIDFNVHGLDLSVTGKAAIGTNQELIQIEGTSTLITPTATNTVPGGVLAVSSNIGHHVHDEFAFVPEVNVQLAYQVSDHVQVQLGYTYLYWLHVARAGTAIDRTVEPALVPTDPFFGTATGTRPTVQFKQTVFSAQGITAGVTFLF